VKGNRAIVVLSTLLLVVAAVATAQPHFAKPAGEGSISVVAVDVAGDGVELPVTVKSMLLGRTAVEIHWTTAGSADGFLVARHPILSPDAQAAKQASSEWLLVRAWQLAGEASDRRGPQRERSAAASSQWFGLFRFDRDHDSRLTNADAALDSLGIFTDRNGNGAIDDGEVKTLADAGVVSVVLLGGEDAGATLEYDDDSTVALRLVEVAK